MSMRRLSPTTASVTTEAAPSKATPPSVLILYLRPAYYTETGFASESGFDLGSSSPHGSEVKGGLFLTHRVQILRLEMA